MTYRDDEFVQVPVPRNLYGPVIALLATRMGKEEEPSLPTGNGAWTQAEIERLKGTITATARAVLDLGSERPGELVSFKAVCEKADLKPNQARAGLAGFTRHVKKYYGHQDWPFAAEWVDDQMQYRVTKEIAEWWLKA